MAIWQYTFGIIPITKYKSLKYDHIEDRDNILSWSGHCLSTGSIELISKVLKPSKAWSDNIRLYGQIDKSCVSLYYNSDVLEEVSIRIDLRDVSRELLEIIIHFIDLNNAIILNMNDCFIKPRREDIIKDIKESKAYAFLKNPELFLEKLETEAKDLK